MAIPIITNVYPKCIRTCTGARLEILGLNFSEKVQITIGEQVIPWDDCTLIRLNSSLLYVDSPDPPFDNVLGVSNEPLDVTIQNLDEDCNPIPGEEFTLQESVAFEMPDLAKPSWLTEVCAALILKFRTCVIQESLMSMHLDYSNQTGCDGKEEVVDPSDPNNKRTLRAKLPALVLIGPSIIPKDEIGAPCEIVKISDTKYKVVAGDKVVDLRFDLLLIANKQQVLLNLVNTVLEFFCNDCSLKVDCERDNQLETVQIDMEWNDDDYPRNNSIMNNSNVISSRGSFFLRNVPLKFYDRKVKESGGYITNVDLCNINIDKSKNCC